MVSSDIILVNAISKSYASTFIIQKWSTLINPHEANILHYPLNVCEKPWEIIMFHGKNSLFLWPFSIANCNSHYQRVYHIPLISINIPLNHYKIPLNHHKPSLNHHGLNILLVPTLWISPHDTSARSFWSVQSCRANEATWHDVPATCSAENVGYCWGDMPWYIAEMFVLIGKKTASISFGLTYKRSFREKDNQLPETGDFT